MELEIIVFLNDIYVRDFTRIGICFNDVPLFRTVSTTISVYRGKFGIIEHLAAGTVSGFLYKFPAGPRAWVVGSLLGELPILNLYSF